MPIATTSRGGTAAATQGRLPVQPLIASAVLGALGQPPEVGEKIVGRLVVLDPALTVAVMRMGNSPHLGLSRRVASASQSMIMLGTRAVRGLATGGTAALVLHDDDPTTPQGFWARSVTTAVSCGIIAKRVGTSPDEAFSAGMMTEVGDLLLQQRDRFGHQSVRTEFGPVYDRKGLDTESVELGRNHTETGAEQLARWWFPERIVRAVKLHHEAPENVTDTLSRVVRCGSALMSYLYRGEPADTDLVNQSLKTCGLAGTRPDLLRTEIEAEVNAIAAEVSA